MTPAYLNDLAHFVACTPGDAIPQDVRTRTALIVADCLGCMVAGNRSKEVTALCAHLARHQGGGEATAVGTPRKLRAADAAFVGGTAGTWHDLDEGNLHTRAHAAIQIVPAALAEAEVLALDGRSLLDAVVLAYEAAGRLWRATRARLAVHPHGTYGPLAAALALCRLRGESPAAVSRAMNAAMTLGIAASRRALSDGATIRNIYSGHSGRAGFEALALRDMGFSTEHDAPASILGNIFGEAFDCAEASAELGQTWWIRKSYFKRFASGRYTHAALDALEIWMDDRGRLTTSADIERIGVKTFFMAATMAETTISTAFGIRFSIPALIAARIVCGPRPLTDDGAAAFDNPAVHAMAGRIHVEEAAQATARYPNHQSAELTLLLSNGTQDVVGVEKILGESDHPLPAGALREKFVELTSPSFGEKTASSIYDDICTLDDCPEIARLADRLRAAVIVAE